MVQPETKFKVGGCSATIFVNEFQTLDGMKSAKNVVLDRTYKDKDGNYQTSKSLSANDIPKAILVLQKAYEHIVSQKQQPPTGPERPGSV